MRHCRLGSEAWRALSAGAPCICRCPVEPTAVMAAVQGSIPRDLRVELHLAMNTGTIVAPSRASRLPVPPAPRLLAPQLEKLACFRFRL